MKTSTKSSTAASPGTFNVEAKLIIKCPGKMSTRRRANIAAWLKKAAKDLEEHGRQYTNGWFRARYLT